MSTDHWKRVEALFEQAAELSPAERAAFLDRACDGDAALRSEVASLLEFDRPHLTHLAEAVQVVADGLDSPMVGRRIGAYRIVRLVGEGGMGAVYEAVRDDDEYRQRVALKLMRRTIDSAMARFRFLGERQILATLEHPAIARLLDGGSYVEPVHGETAPYLVMEYVDGVPITRYCEENALSIEARLRLFQRVLAAVSFAHRKLIVHRDLKPGNILVSQDGGPKLLDFGIAKLVDPAQARDRTATALRAMTPDYASPEQVRGEPETTSSDIYSLGLILYEILAATRGQTLESYSTAEIYHVICSRQPPPPSAVAPPPLRKALRGDLDAIVAAAIHKDAARRYTSAEQLSEDIDRYLTGRAVRAHKDSLAYRGKKFVRRHVWPVTSAVLLIAVLVGGIAATQMQARRAERRFEELRAISNRFLFEFHDEVAKLPGSTAARELIVRTALQFLGSLSRESTDPALLTEVAVAYARVGDAQGRPNQPNLGRLADAAASYEKSVGILSALRARGKADLAGRRALVQYLGRLSSLYQNAGDREASRSAAERALAFSRDLPPGDPQDEELMGMAEVAIGDIAMASDQAQAGLDHYRAGLAHRTRASDGSAPRLRSLAVAYERVGTALHLLGDLQGALEAHTKQEGVYHEMLQRTPPDPRARRGMMVACQFLGNIYGATNEPSLGDTRRALEYYGRMLDLALQAHTADPNDTEAKTDVVRAHLKVADVLDTAPSIGHLRHALALAQTLPEGPQKHSLLVSTWRYLADRQRRMGDLAGAAQALDRAEDFMGRRLTSVASNSAPDERRAAVKASRGELLLQRGDVEGALRHFTDTLAFYESRHAAAANDLAATWDLSSALDRMARAAARDTARVREYRERQVKLWRDWNVRFVRSSFSDRQLEEAERLWTAAQAGTAPLR